MTLSFRLAEEQNGDDIATIDKIKNLITIAKKQVSFLTTYYSLKILGTYVHYPYSSLFF